MYLNKNGVHSIGPKQASEADFVKARSLTKHHHRWQVSFFEREITDRFFNEPSKQVFCKTILDWYFYYAQQESYSNFIDNFYHPSYLFLRVIVVIIFLLLLWINFIKQGENVSLEKYRWNVSFSLTRACFRENVKPS